MLAINSEHRLRSENLPYDIDVWYPRIKSHTYRTEFYPLTRAEAEAILHYHNTSWRSLDDLSQEDVAVLRKLEHRLDQLITKKFPLGAFLRLCGRSPKDGEPLDCTWILPSYHKELDRLVGSGLPLSGNTKLVATSKVQYLKVTCGAEAMSLILTSERVFTDLHDWLKYGEPEQIVLREWDPDISYDLEFRMFVYGHKVTAISQYDHYCVYPQLQGQEDYIAKVLMEAWDKVHAAVAESSYVIDFAYFPPSQGPTARLAQARVIEISPFLECTGPALFSWKADLAILKGTTVLNANDLPPFRIKTIETPQLDLLVEANWEERWMEAQAKVPYWALYQDAKPLPPERENNEPQETILFVYGTLKQGFHWHDKFLSRGARFLGTAQTLDPVPLVLGASGVPYLLDPEAAPPAAARQEGGGGAAEEDRRVRGELYAVDAETLRNLDEYEGVGKGHYARRPLAAAAARVASARWPPAAVVRAKAYLKARAAPGLWARPRLGEYSAAAHAEGYNAVRHVRVKQQGYL
ncbi:unnamed protein product, partial [Heterosigma akashiwo]